MQRIDPLRINCLQNMAGQLLRRVFSDQQISESKGRMNANERLLENDTEVLLSYLIFHRCRRSNIGEKPHQQKRNGKWFYHSLLVKLADGLEIAFIRLTLQYFFSSIARLRVACRFFLKAISAIHLLFSIRALHRLQSWTKYMGNLYPLPPNQGWENGAFWLLCSFILDLAGMGVRCSILFCPRL